MIKTSYATTNDNSTTEHFTSNLCAFKNLDNTIDLSQYALSLQGGGGMQLASGQITDDGEMTLCCARGLANCEPGRFDLEQLALQYKEWVLSPPFDMGITIGASIGCVLKGQHNPVESQLSDRLHLHRLSKNISKKWDTQKVPLNETQ